MCLLLLLLLFNTGPWQTKLLMRSTNSATPEHKSNPMSLMVWMCNLTLKVTMFVIIMKLKESCSLLICPMGPYLLGKKINSENSGFFRLF